MRVEKSVLQIGRSLVLLAGAFWLQGCMDANVQPEQCDKIEDAELQHDILSSIANHFGSMPDDKDHVILLDPTYKFRQVTYVDCGTYYGVENAPFDPREGFFAVGVTEIFKVNKTTMGVVSFKEV